MKNTELAQKIKDLLVRKGLSQEKLAEAAPITCEQFRELRVEKLNPGEIR
jgi:hypothetical protein